MKAAGIRAIFINSCQSEREDTYVFVVLHTPRQKSL